MEARPGITSALTSSVSKPFLITNYVTMLKVRVWVIKSLKGLIRTKWSKWIKTRTGGLLMPSDIALLKTITEFVSISISCER